MTKQRQILAAAKLLFGRYGLKKVTTDDIAREAHVSKSTIYRLYRNKHEILKDVVRGELARMRGTVAAAIAEQDTVEGQCRAHLTTKIDAVRRLVTRHGLTKQFLSAHWDRTQELRAEFVAGEVDLIRGILDRGVASGELEVADTMVTARLLAASLESLEYPWSLPGSEQSVPDRIEHMQALVLDGLRKRNPTAPSATGGLP